MTARRCTTWTGEGFPRLTGLRSRREARARGRLAPLFLAALLGCSNTDTRSATTHGVYGVSAPLHGPEVVWSNNSGEPEYIDPGKCSEAIGGTIINNIFEGLTQRHPKTLASMPGVAKGWEISRDGLVYTFFLRRSFWSDGKPLTAADFEWSFKRVLNPKTASKYASFLHFIQNAKAYNTAAVLLTGLPPDTTAEAVRQAVEKMARVDEVGTATHLGAHTSATTGFFVYVGGEGQKRRAGRRKLLALTTLLGTPINSEITPQSVVRARAKDEHTLEVHLEVPLPYVLDLFSFYTSMPVPRHIIEPWEAAGNNPDAWTKPETIVSNGAYILAEWKFRQYMLLRKNDQYWDKKNVRTPTIRLGMVNSYNTTLNLYKTGEFDAIGENDRLPSEFLDHLSGYKDFIRSPYLATYYYLVNTRSPPLDNRKLRKAMSLAIDRQSVVQYITRGGQTASSDLCPAGVGGYPGLKSKIYDPDRARALLKEAGYDNGAAVPPITLIYNTAETHKQIAVAVQQMWKDVLGVKVTIENLEWKVYQKRLRHHDFQLARRGWVGDYNDPFTFLELLSKYSLNNHSGWSDPRYDALLTKANKTLDRNLRHQILLQAEALAMDAAPLLPLYGYVRSEMWKPYMRGIWPNYTGNHFMKYWWVDTDYTPEKNPDRRPGDDPPPPMLSPDPAPTRWSSIPVVDEAAAADRAAAAAHEPAP